MRQLEWYKNRFPSPAAVLQTKTRLEVSVKEVVAVLQTSSALKLDKY